MTLFSRLERRSSAEGRGWYPIPGVKNITHGAGGEAEDALGIAAVNFCVSMIADTISTLPVDVFRRRDSIRERLDNPSWTVRPNPDELWGDFMQKVMTSILFDGNAYILLVRDSAQVVKQMYVLAPGDVDVKAENNKRYYIYDGQPMSEGKILHISGLMLPGHIKGVSPLESMRLTMDLATAAEEFGRDHLKNGIHMSGVIEVPPGAKVEADEAERLGTQFGARHTGGKHAVGVLTGGATWKPITITPEQAQFIETRKFNKIDIAQFYKIPAYMVDPSVTSTWGSGVAEQNLMFLQHTLMPYLIKIEQAFSTLVLAGQQYFKFNTRALTRGRSEQEMELLVKATNNGLMTINEGRALLDMEPLAGGDEVMVPLNISPLSYQERKLAIQEEKAMAEDQAAKEVNTNDTQN